MTLIRRTFIATAAGALALAAAPSIAQDAYPSKPIRIVHGFSPFFKSHFFASIAFRCSISFVTMFAARLATSSTGSNAVPGVNWFGVGC